MRRRAGVGLLAAACLLAVAGAGASRAAQDERVVEIDTLNVRDVLYHLWGGGANTLALIDEINGGVVLVDTKRAGSGGALRKAVEQVTDLPVTTIITTTAHPDHAGGNADFAGVPLIIAHENTRSNLERAGAEAGAGLPTTAFTDHHVLLEDLDRIELHHFGRAHTDGDVVVVFPEKQTAYLGALFPEKAVPAIDAANGGSGLEYPDTLARAAAALDGVTRVITARGPRPYTYAGRGPRVDVERRAAGRMYLEDLEEYAGFMRAFVDAVETAFRAGRGAAEAAADLQLPARYAEYGTEHAQATVETIYAELAARGETPRRTGTGREPR